MSVEANWIPFRKPTAAPVGLRQILARFHAEQCGLNTDSNLRSVSFEALASGPTAEEAVMLIEEVQVLKADLDDDQREMREMQLQGFTLAEIAERKDCSERTVLRLLEKLKSRFEQRLSQLAS